mmetsp:Transcript_10830/g.29733  ORF Transcript_10830/g.29733 Transcript_10830/m.29733 type:complete len:212 (+) Transcript_10830:1399-2034(+)
MLEMAARPAMRRWKGISWSAPPMEPATAPQMGTPTAAAAQPCRAMQTAPAGATTPGMLTAPAAATTIGMQAFMSLASRSQVTLPPATRQAVMCLPSQRTRRSGWSCITASSRQLKLPSMEAALSFGNRCLLVVSVAVPPLLAAILKLHQAFKDQDRDTCSGKATRALDTTQTCNKSSSRSRRSSNSSRKEMAEQAGEPQLRRPWRRCSKPE